MAAKNYKQIAKRNITRPRDVERPPRLAVFGRNKKGKTAFCLSAPDVLVVDPEHGTDEFKRQNPPVWHVETWNQLDDVHKYLRGGGHPYRYVALDGMTRMHRHALQFIKGEKAARLKDLNRKPRKGHTSKQDYGRANELMKDMIEQFCTLPDVGVVFTCQERVERLGGDDDEEDEDEGDMATVLTPDLPKGARGDLMSWVDVMGRLYVVRQTVTKKGKEIVRVRRRLWIGPHERFDTGYRADLELGSVGDKPLVNPTVPRLVNLIRTGDPVGDKKETQ